MYYPDVDKTPFRFTAFLCII